MPRTNPFEVEPEYSEEELRNIEIERENDLVNNAEINIDLNGIQNNCSCGKCVPEWLGLGSHEEKIENLKKFINWKDVREGIICCRQIEEVVLFLNDVEMEDPALCVTSDIDFKSMCQRKRALKGIYRSYLHSRRRPLPAEFSNRSYRYTAYRTYTHMVFHKLGRGVRKIVPFCVLLNVRKNFPEVEVNSYTSYKPGVEIERFRPN